MAAAARGIALLTLIGASLARQIQHAARVSTDDGAEEYVGYKGRLGDGVLTVDNSPFIAGLSCTVGTISVVPNAESTASAGCAAGDEWCHVRTHPSTWRVGDIIVGGAHWGCSVHRKRPEHPTPFYVEIVEAVTAAAAAAAGEGNAGALTFLVEVVSPLECFQHMSLGMYRLPSAGAGSGAIASGFDMRRGFDWSAGGLHRQGGGGDPSFPEGGRGPRDGEGDGDDVPFHFPLHAASHASPAAAAAAAAAEHRRGGPSLFGETDVRASRAPSGEGASLASSGAAGATSAQQQLLRGFRPSFAGPAAAGPPHSPQHDAPERADAHRGHSGNGTAVSSDGPRRLGDPVADTPSVTVNRYAKYGATVGVGDASLELVFRYPFGPKYEGAIWQEFANKGGSPTAFEWPPPSSRTQPLNTQLQQSASESRGVSAF
jgi:hypothetical protein